jgi:hypothetical protein
MTAVQEPAAGIREPRPRPKDTPGWVRAGIAMVIAVGVVARFVPRGPLWLDEALSANIAELPLGRIGEALRRDGHPPLYYWLLHLWGSLVGSSPWALRALSGLLGVATLPLAYLAGLRVGGRPRRTEPAGAWDAPEVRARHTAWAAVTLLAGLPFAVRYSSETRMYALVMLGVLAGYLLVCAHLDRPRWTTLAAATAVGAALLWTHYWSMWLLGATGVVLAGVAVTAHRHGNRTRRTAAVGLLGGLAVAGLSFLPWLPTLLYQSAHTGTPWGEPVRPAAIGVLGMIYLVGGPVAEPQLVAYLVAGLLVAGVLGATNRRGRLELGWHVAPTARPEALLVALTLALAWAASFTAQSAFTARYLSVVVPLVVVVAAMGLTAIGSDRWRRAVAAVVLAGFAVGIVAEVARGRTQAGEIADAVVRVLDEPGAGPRPVLVACPDQNGPSLQRALRDRGRSAEVEVLTYPDLADPRFVDWVDYADRNERTDPAEVAARVAERAAGRTLLVAATGGYRTLEGQCEALVAALAAARGQPSVLVPPAERTEDEPAIELYRFPWP